MEKESSVLVLSATDVRKEILRKTIHMTIALVPTLAHFHLIATVALLIGGILLYVVNETSRIVKGRTGLVSRITSMAARSLERGFIWGPVTLGFGALLALVYYPSPAATIAIYALAFGDGFASLLGRLVGRRPWSFLGGKTLVGTLSCYLAVFFSTLFVFRDPLKAMVIAFTATLLEMIPLKDFDNILIPIGTGFVATLLL